MSEEPKQNLGRGLIDSKLVEAPHQVLVVPRWLFCFGTLVDIDVICGYFLLFVLDIKLDNR